MKKRILITDGRKRHNPRDYGGWFMCNDAGNVNGVMRAALRVYKVSHPSHVICFDVRVGDMTLNNVIDRGQIIKINTNVVTEAEFNKQKCEASKGWVVTHNEPACKPVRWWWPF